MKTRRIMVAVLMMALFVGCATTKRDWEAAQARNSVRAYEEFLSEHSGSPFESAANKRIEELRDHHAWQEAKKEGRKDAYERYLNNHPAGIHAQTVRTRIAEFQQYAPHVERDPELRAKGLGAILVNVTDPDTEVFILSRTTEVKLTRARRSSLRDALLAASPVQKGKRLTLEPGQYVLAVRKHVPRDSRVLSDLGGKAPGNDFMAPSKDGRSEFVVGGGIKAGALFKAVDDVYLTYGGALFAHGPGKLNQQNIARYSYLRAQGTQVLLFRFLKDERRFELWLLSEHNIEPGLVLECKVRVPAPSSAASVSKPRVHPQTRETQTEHVHARHILVKSKSEASSIRQKLLDRADFAQMARLHSICPSSQRGGDLGTFPRGRMVKPFEDAAFSQEPGVIGPVVKTRFGYHIIQVIE